MCNQVILTLLSLLTLCYLSKGQVTPPELQPADLRTCREFSRDCDFEFRGFEGKVPTFPIGRLADTPFTPRIVSKDPAETLGVLNSNGITPEVLFSEGQVIPITEFGDPPFTPSHSKPYPLPDGGSGIGHPTFKGDQLSLARGSCVRVFFTSYQLIVGPRPTDVRNINAKREDFKCVVFFTK